MRLGDMMSMTDAGDMADKIRKARWRCSRIRARDALTKWNTALIPKKRTRQGKLRGCMGYLASVFFPQIMQKAKEKQFAVALESHQDA